MLNQVEAFVEVTNLQNLFAIDDSEVSMLVACVLGHKNVSYDEVSVHFVSSEEISRLHEEFFDDPTPTDCISFPVDDAEEDDFYKMLGDVFVCPEVAFEYSKKHITDFNEELSLYIIHGLLHLLGFDDIEEEDRLEMRKQEAECLELLKKNNLILKAKKNLLS